jgi:cation diffusion facilitator CzcD-associated flavoprotein CzcO
MQLEALTELARRELAQLNFPAANWVLPRVGPDGRPLLDALVVGGGMCGQTATFALLREGVRNIRCVDRGARGREGPWATFARMDILRSPKHLTGPDLGVAALTYRAWHEAKFGTAHWDELHKIARLDWAKYLLWVRETAGLPVENEIEVVSLELLPECVRARLRNGEAIHCRKIVLALGREGSGAPRWPRFATFDPAKPRPNVFHSADDIDFKVLAGRRIGVLGAGSSAFDNAGEALEAGAREVVMFARRPVLPQVNKSKWTAFPGFQHGYSALDDARRWRFYTYVFSEQVPPPYESVLRCERHPGFSLRFGEGWNDIQADGSSVKIQSSQGGYRFDAVIVATGFDVNLVDRPEIASFRNAVRTWKQHVPASEAEKFPEEARFPYLGDAFQLMEKETGAAPGVERIHVFNWGATMSHGALAGDIPGIEIGAQRLTHGIVRDLFVEDADRHWERLLAHNEDEMKPTRYFVPLEQRKK